jgi:hypothetical protein
MLPIAEHPLAPTALLVLENLREQVSAEGNYAAKVQFAKRAWDTKSSTKAKADAFGTIRDTLARMCVGPVRCAYCEDSLADEVEHIKPKSLFPDIAFVWENYLFACGPCNGPKGNRYGYLVGNAINEYVRRCNDPIVPPPAGGSALIDPRTEDPMNFLELDLGGVAPNGEVIDGTFEFLPIDIAGAVVAERAKFSIDVLGLNREVMRVARENAFGGFRARLREYVQEALNGAPERRLAQLRDDLLSTPHLTVFAEMLRQRAVLPAIDELLSQAPEAEAWLLVADAG